jgi:hypothetical protein
MGRGAVVVTTLARELARLLAEALVADAKAHPDLAKAPVGPETQPEKDSSKRATP